MGQEIFLILYLAISLTHLSASDANSRHGDVVACSASYRKNH